jgi:hypothetical protein
MEENNFFQVLDRWQQQRHNALAALSVFAELSSYITFSLHKLFADPRLAQVPMMSSPIPTIAISLAYIYFAKVHHATKHFPYNKNFSF